MISFHSMDTHGCTQPTPLLLPHMCFTFFFFMDSLLLCSAADLGLPPECVKPFNCGNISVEYPFWVMVDKPQYCWGRQELRLDCAADGVLIMTTLSKDKFRIIDLNSTLRIVRMARNEFFDGGICSTEKFSSIYSRDGQIFKIFRFPEATYFVNMTLYYNCDPFVPEVPNWGYDFVNCTTLDGTNKPLVSLVPHGCKESFVVPIQSWLYEDLQEKRKSLVNILTRGFKLTWNLKCRICNASMDECHGMPKQVICPLPDAPATLRKKKSKILTVGISTASAIIGLSLLIAAAFFVIKRRKQLIIHKSIVIEGSATDASSSSVFTANHYRTVLHRESNLDCNNARNCLGIRVFSFDELVEATHNFDATKELGNGGFGVVYHGKLRDGREVAVKRLYERSLKRVEQFLNEVAILTRLRHPNLVTLYGCTSRNCRELLLVYDYITNGTVADHLHGPHAASSPMPWPTRIAIASETASALSYLHASGIIHRDVKTNNILVDHGFHVKVADFGLSRLFPNDVSHVSTAPQGTPGYVDPVYYEVYRLTEKSDVYSFGVVLVELVSGKRAVDTRRSRHDVNLANMALGMIQSGSLRELVDPHLGFDEEEGVRREVAAMAELAFRCLQTDGDLRPSMGEVIEGLRLIEEGREKVGARSPNSVVNCQWISNSTNSGG